MIEIFILSIVQGISEFLPVSSSAHLFLINNFFSISSDKLMLDVSLHIGSFLAVVLFFKKDLLNFVKNKKILSLVLASSIPVILAGYLITKFDLIDHLRNMKVAGWMTIIFAILMHLSDKFKTSKSINKNFSFKDAFIIGLIHTASLVPGVSRSGIAITSARMLSYSRVDSAKISFLLSIPTLGAVSIYGINQLAISDQIYDLQVNFLAIVLSFVFSYITIKYFLIFLKKFSLVSFVVYRIFLGIVILFYAY